MQGVIQSAFLWGYMATQLLGGTLADVWGGKRVMAIGIAWFSLASLLLPLALSPSIAAAGHSVTAILAARCAVVSACDTSCGVWQAMALVKGHAIEACQAAWGVVRSLHALSIHNRCT
jgi:MFS family permease